MNLLSFAGVTVAVAFLLPSIAVAQATPDIEDALNRDTQIHDALREQRRTLATPLGEGSGTIDGEAGVYVLTVNDIFFVGGSVGTGWSENPLHTVDDVGSSFHASAAATAGIQTMLGGAFDAGLAASISGIDYDKSFAPSSRTVTGSANIGTSIKRTPLYIGLGAYGGWTYDNRFKNGSGFYGASASVSGRIPLGQRTALGGRLNAGRQMGEVKENNAWNAIASIDVTHFINEKIAVGIGAQAQRTWFDNFYEDVTFIKRRDWSYAVNANASWSVTPWLALGTSVGYEKRDSRFFLSNFDGLEASINLSARKRF